MYLFPNMKIYINTQPPPPPPPQPSPRIRTNVSRTASSVLSGLIQNVLRRASDNGGATTDPPEDIQFYFGFEAPNGDAATDSENPIRVLSRATELFVSQAREETASTELCSICRNGIGDGEICRRIRTCGHFFHHACIDSWFDRNNQTCPVCRAVLTTTETPE
ncbi:E3 ubiquitin-protein ligase [bacterium]|nr:E3 ubiquitin-protein ligase [bacterium]